MLNRGFTLLGVLVLAAAGRASGDPPAGLGAWLAAAAKDAPPLARIVEPRAGAPAPRITAFGRAFAGTIELARLEGELAALASARDAVALDVGWHEGEDLDRWLRSGEGDFERIVPRLGPIGWSSAELGAWLARLRSREARPRIVGIGVGDPKPVAQEVLAFVGKALPDALGRAEFAIRPLTLDGRNGEPRWLQLSENERAILALGLDEVLDLVRGTEEDVVKRTSAAEHARAVRGIESLRQHVSTMRFRTSGGEHDPRGRILAENALGALTDAGAGARLFALVELRDLARASDPDSFAAQVRALGGLTMLCLGSACGSARFRALDPNATGPAALVPRELVLDPDGAGPLERALERASAGKSWVLDLREPPKGEQVVAWLAVPRSLRSARALCGAAGETPWDHLVLGDFEALIWCPSAQVSGAGSAVPR